MFELFCAIHHLVFKDSTKSVISVICDDNLSFGIEISGQYLPAKQLLYLLKKTVAKVVLKSTSWLTARVCRENLKQWLDLKESGYST